MARPRDYQRSKVYNWENSQLWCEKKQMLTHNEVLASLKKLGKIFGFQSSVKFSTGRGASRANRFGMTLKEWGMCYGVILHEYAHILCDNYLLGNTDHGKHFVTVYCVLLNKLHPLQPSYKELSASLRDRNIDFIEFDYIEDILNISNRNKPFVNFRENPIVPAEKKKRTSPKKRVEALLLEYPNISIDKDHTFWVYCDDVIDDPYYDEHYCDTWKEVEEKVNHYVQLLNQQHIQPRYPYSRYRLEVDVAARKNI